MTRFLFICLLFPTIAMSQETISAVAARFYKSLSAAQQKEVQFSFDSDERLNWHFIPKDRKGIPLETLNEAQRKAAFNLVAVCMSADGARKVSEIIQLENVLRKLEGRSDSDTYRDPGKYYLSLFGTPADKSIWGWRIEGHHISLNFSTQNNKLMAGTPGFLGSNPAVVPDGPQKGLAVLREETAGGFALIQSLNKDQLLKAVIREKAYNDILTGASRKALINEPKGIRYNELNKEQQALLIKLLSIYIHRYTKLFANAMMKDIETAGLDNILFSWAGAQQQQAGEGYYYRIQGPTLIIEYDNTQNNANHVHTVVRDLKNDFGGDVLMEHYKQQH